jgi:FKBP-type peptidyl-prolyl cis-trans isomerase FkpA
MSDFNKEGTMKKTWITLGLVATLSVACNKETKISTDEDKVFYSVGVMFGERLQSLNLNEKELAALQQGLADSAKGVTLKANPEEHRDRMQSLFQDRMNQASVKVKEEGAKFLEEFIAKEGATKTESGLAYKIIKAGEGAKPGEESEVVVHYTGTLIDGTVFDSSRERGETVNFPLNRVIRGWTEGLQLIGPGGQIKLVIPSELAYGEAGAPPKIPGGATLVFDVELIEVK